MKIDRELIRGAGSVAVLKLLSRNEMYGYEIVQALAEGSSPALALGQSTLYPMLYNLEAKGFVQATWREAGTGRRRKYYALTSKGRHRLAEDIGQWKELVEALRRLGILDPSAKGQPA